MASVKGMDTIETWIIDKAREFDAIGDWPQPFEAFVPPGQSLVQAAPAIHRLKEQGRLSLLGFEAAGMPRVDVVAGLGPAIPHIEKAGPGEPGHHRSPMDHATTIGG
jgi:hypothetical protein